MFCKLQSSELETHLNIFECLFVFSVSSPAKPDVPVLFLLGDCIHEGSLLVFEDKERKNLIYTIMRTLKTRWMEKVADRKQ